MNDEAKGISGIPQSAINTRLLIFQVNKVMEANDWRHNHQLFSYQFPSFIHKKFINIDCDKKCDDERRARANRHVLETFLPKINKMSTDKEYTQNY